MLEKELSTLFVHATPTVIQSAMATNKPKTRKGSSMRAPGSSSKGRAPSNIGPLLTMTVPHHGDGGDVEISVQVRVCHDSD